MSPWHPGGMRRAPFRLGRWNRIWLPLLWPLVTAVLVVVLGVGVLVVRAA